MTPPIDSIVDQICGAYPATGAETAEQSFVRGLCFQLADHYIGMSVNDRISPAWLQANSGWASAFNTALQAQRLARLSGSKALDFLDIERLADQVNVACNTAGYQAR